MPRELLNDYRIKVNNDYVNNYVNSFERKGYRVVINFYIESEYYILKKYSIRKIELFSLNFRLTGEFYKDLHLI